MLMLRLLIVALMAPTLAFAQVSPIAAGDRLTWDGFADLLPGKSATISPRLDAPLGALGQKKLLLVLSNQAIAAFDGFDAARKTIGAWSQKQKDARIKSTAARIGGVATGGQTGFGNLIASVATPFDGEELKPYVAKALIDFLRGRFAAVGFADDLSGFRGSEYDYALVLDLQFSHELPAFLQVLDDYQARPKRVDLDKTPLPFFGARSWVLLDRDLQVVRKQIRPVTRYNIQFAGALTGAFGTPGGSEADRARDAVITKFTWLRASMSSIFWEAGMMDSDFSSLR